MAIANRGFASMDPERRRQIASQGGRAAHRLGRAHKWTKAEARAAVRKRRENAARRERHADDGFGTCGAAASPVPDHARSGS
jgi:hypothetical protein